MPSFDGKFPSEHCWAGLRFCYLISCSLPLFYFIPFLSFPASEWLTNFPTFPFDFSAGFEAKHHIPLLWVVTLHIGAYIQPYRFLILGRVLLSSCPAARGDTNLCAGTSQWLSVHVGILSGILVFPSVPSLSTQLSTYLFHGPSLSVYLLIFLSLFLPVPLLCSIPAHLFCFWSIDMFIVGWYLAVFLFFVLFLFCFLIYPCTVLGVTNICQDLKWQS